MTVLTDQTWAKPADLEHRITKLEEDIVSLCSVLMDLHGALSIANSAMNDMTEWLQQNSERIKMLEADRFDDGEIIEIEGHEEVRL